MAFTEKELKKALDRTTLALFQKPGLGFFANLYCLLDRSWDYTMPTACTNGKDLRINPDFFMPLSPEMKITLLCHEMRHVIDQHMTRIGSRTPKRWNYACDHAINLEMKRDGFVFDVDHLADPAFEGMSAEQIYERLPEEAEFGAGGSIALPFGEDFDPMQEDLQPAQKVQVETEIQNLVIRAANLTRLGGGWGDVPEEIKTLIDKLLNPRLPWQKLLRKFFDAQSRDGFSWQRRNRRFHDIYMPSRISPQDSLNSVLWGLDISCSVTDKQLKVFNSEVAHVHNTYSPEVTHIASFDTKIHDIFFFREDEKFQGLEFTGRGGTNLKPLFEHALKVRPQVLVVFSDLDCLAIPKEDEPPFPVLWLCIDNPAAEVNFGKLVHFNSK